METLEPTPSTNGRSRLLWVLVGGALAVALIAAGVLVIPRLLNPASAVNVTASAMPAGTQLYFAFNPHFGDLPNGGVVLEAWNDPDVTRPVEEGLRRWLAELNLDWEEDVAPWLGDEVGIGMSNFTLDPDALEDAPVSMVFAAATRDAARSDAFLAQLRSNHEENGATFTETTYRNVATVEQTDASYGVRLAFATVNDLVLGAVGRDGSDVLHAAIDAVLDGGGFDTSANYQAAIGPLRGGRAVTAFVDVGGLYGPMLDQFSAEGVPPAINLSDLRQLRVAMGISFEPNGVLMEFATLGDSGIGLPVESRTGSPAVPNPNRMLRAVPDSAFVYMSGRRLSDWFDDMLELLKSAPFSPGVPGIEESLGDFERQTGIDLREDVFGWMTGEAAFVMMPGSGLSLSGPSPFGFAMLIEATDKPRAESGIQKLFTALAAETGGEIEEARAGDYRLHSLVDPTSGEPILVYGLIGDNLVLAFPESAAQKIATAASRPLADDEDFKAATAPLPANTIGYVYLKPKPIVDLLTLGLTFSGQECAACAVFEPLRALAFTVEYPPAQAGVVRSALFMLLDVEE